jgi:ADP-ribosylglycohydrolase
MALCLADSLVACKGFDPVDQINRYVRWYRERYWSSAGRCFDIGNATAAALHRLETTGAIYSQRNNQAGNGSLMRLAPVPIFFSLRGEIEDAIHHAALSSLTTHGSIVALHACRYLAVLTVGALQGESKDKLLIPMYEPIPGLWDRAGLEPEIAAVAAGSYQAKEERDIKSTGYSRDTLEAALWAFYSTDTFRDGVIPSGESGGRL